MDASAALAAKPKAQVILCLTEPERERWQALFPRAVVLAANGGFSGPDFAGRNVVTAGAGLAAEVAGFADPLKVIDIQPPESLQPAQAIAWARDNARAYVPTPPEPIDAQGADLRAEPATTGEGSLVHDSGALTDNVAMPAAPPQDGSASFIPPVSDSDPDEILTAYSRLSTGSPDEPPDLTPFEHPSAWDTTPKGQWPQPMDFWGDGGASLPELDYACLPPELSDYTFDQAALTGCSVAMHALNAIVGLGGIVHGTIRVRPKRHDYNWIEPCILWGVTCGESGAGKGPAARAIIRAIFGHERERRKLDDEARKGYEWELELSRAAREKAKKNAGIRPPDPDKPQIERLIMENFTTEGFCEVAEDNSRLHLLIYMDELAALWGRMDAYSPQRNADKDRPFILALYEGEPSATDRVTPVGQPKRSRFLTSSGASILGGVQPSTLARIVHRGHYAEDGMMARFIVVHGAAQKPGEEREQDKIAAANFHRLLDRLIALRAGTEPVSLSDDAHELRIEASAWIRKAAASQLPPGMGAHVSKWEALLCRLALGYHAIHCAAQNMPIIAPEIPLAQVERAWRFLRSFLWHHSMYFYLGVLADQRGRNLLRDAAALILARLDREHGVLTTTELWHYLYDWRGLNDSGKRELIGQLIDAGWLGEGAGRSNVSRMPTRYPVNDLIWDGRFAAQITEEKRRRAERYDAIREGRARSAGED